MSEKYLPYKVLQEVRVEEFLRVLQVDGPTGPGRLYWFEVREPEARAAFFRFRKALRALESLGVLPGGLEISAKPGRYYVFWPSLSAPSALPAKGRKVVQEVGRVLASLLPLGYALPDLDIRYGERGLEVADLDPLAEHAEEEAARLGGRFIRNAPRAKARRGLSAHSWLPGLLFAAVGILLLLAAGYRYLNPPVYVLPDLRGLSPREAVQKLRSSGLNVVFSEISEPKKPRDVIVEQNPDPGARVKPGRRLELLLNRPKEGRVPNVVGQPLEKAQQQLLDSGYLPAGSGSAFSNKPADTVIASAPPVAAPLPAGSGVKLLVSQGQPPRNTMLPDLKGLSLDQAKYLISVAELRLGEVKQEPSPEPNGTVIAQSPPPGVDLAAGSPVTLTLATKAEVLLPENNLLEPQPQPEQPASDESPQTAPPQTPPSVSLAAGERVVPIKVALPKQSNSATVHVRLVVKDDSGERTPIDTFAPVGTSLQGSVKVKGDAHFQLYLDNFLYQQWTSKAP